MHREIIRFIFKKYKGNIHGKKDKESILETEIKVYLHWMHYLPMNRVTTLLDIVASEYYLILANLCRN